MLGRGLDPESVQLLARYLVAFRGGNPDARQTPSAAVQGAMRLAAPAVRHRPTPAWFNAVSLAVAMLDADPSIFGRIAADPTFDPFTWHKEHS